MAMTTSNKVLAAGALGFLAGILYAPRKGTETQAQIKDKLGQMKQDVATKADKAKDKIREMKHKESAMLSKADRKMNDAADKLAS